MEIQNLYDALKYVFSMTSMRLYPVLFWSIVTAVGVCLVVFVLQGIGLYTMAKKRNLSKKWLAFIPFVSTYYIGKLAGEGQMFGKKVSRLNVYTLLSQIVVALLCFARIAAEVYLYTQCLDHLQYDQNNIAYWAGLTGMELKILRFYEISSYLLMVLGLIYEILLTMLLLGLYRQYSPKNYNFLGVLTFLYPVSSGAILFALRKRKAVDFDAYMRARREAYMRQQQQYQNMYGTPYNPYGTPYGQRQNPYNPYGQSAPQNQPKEEEEPFAEFASNKKTEQEKDDTPQEDRKDDFFS